MLKSIDLEIIFTPYEDEFIRYLVPWVVNDLQNDDEAFEQIIKSGELNVKIRNYIDASIERYFDYVMPLPMNINTEYFKQQTLDKIHKYLAKEGYYVSIFEHVYDNDKPHEIIDPETNTEFGWDYKAKIDKIKANIETTIDKIKANNKREQLKNYIDNNLEQLTSIQLKSYKQFINLKDIQSLKVEDQQILQEGYKYYQNKWDQHVSVSESKRKSKPLSVSKSEREALAGGEREISVYDIIDKIVAEENVETPPKTIDEIKNLTYKYRKGYETFNNIYDYYIQKRTEKYNRLHYKLEPFTTNKHGYKQKGNADTPNYFPLKSNFKKYSLHTIAKRYSYIIDLMFENRKYCYLVAININTRKLWVEPTNIKIKPRNEVASLSDQSGANSVQGKAENANIIEITYDQKSSTAYLQALQTMMYKGMIIKYLKGDGEKAFESIDATRFYQNHDIKFETVPRQITKYPEFMHELNMVKSLKSEPTHSALGIIDRVIRTIRDIAYNLEVPEINPSVMVYIVNLYNNTPHKTLSKYAGIKVSPNDVDNNPELEEFIVRKIHQKNYEIMHCEGYNLYPGEEVVVYNPNSSMAKRRTVIQPGNWKVKEYLGTGYTLMDEKGNIQQFQDIKFARYRAQASPLAKAARLRSSKVNLKS